MQDYFLYFKNNNYLNNKLNNNKNFIRTSQHSETFQMGMISVVEYYLRYNRLPTEYRNLNSNATNENAKNTFHINKNTIENQDSNKINDKFFEVDVKIKNVNTSFKKRIYMIQNLKECDIVNWLEDFEKICKLTEWNENEMRIILQNVINDKNFDVECLEDDYKKNRNLILKYIFPKETGISILMELETISQSNFYTISEYYNKIHKILSKYSICCDIGKAEFERKFEESFMRGLCKHTRLEIVKINERRINKILEYLKNLESNIFTLMNEQKYKQKIKTSKKDFYNKINEIKYISDNNNNFKQTNNLNTKKMVQTPQS